MLVPKCVVRLGEGVRGIQTERAACLDTRPVRAVEEMEIPTGSLGDPNEMHDRVFSYQSPTGLMSVRPQLSGNRRIHWWNTLLPAYGYVSSAKLRTSMRIPDSYKVEEDSGCMHIFNSHSLSSPTLL